MVHVEPIPSQPAATVRFASGETALVIADLHTGIEAAIRWEAGLELPSRGPDRRARIERLIEQIDPTRIVFLGDVMHSIGPPSGAERGELEVLLEAIDRPVTIVKGNHDGRIEDILEENQQMGADLGQIQISNGAGIRIDAVGFVHGHAWPSRTVLGGSTIVMGHEHPCVRLVDEVGGTRIDRVWLRGQLDPTPFLEHDPSLDQSDIVADELVVVPAFNELVGGTWVNEPEQEFLSPFLPAAIPDADAYLLDGTRLGPFATV